VAQQWYTLQQPPALSAKAFLLYDLNAAQTLYQQQADVALPPASLTKLMTALLVLEADRLNEQVTVRGSDLVGGATMGLQVGERLTVAELLRGLLIPSGNDAATALARHSGGSVAAFVEQMNQRGQQLGLTQTHFVNPHGLDAPGHVTSATDLLTITRQVLAYPLAQEIVATSAATVAGHRLRNTNELLTTYPGANGVKTGTSDAAGQCLIASIAEEGQRVLIILLGSQDRYQDARALYGHYREHYQWVTGNPNQLGLLNRLYDHTGNLWYLRTVGAPPPLLLHPWQTDLLTSFRHLRLPPADQPWQAGLEVGVLEWRFGGTIIGRQALVLW
jgi:D-alanyl-D-alanine carboxypeptidase (penicillin-binding protein 5/6)